MPAAICKRVTELISATGEQGWISADGDYGQVGIGQGLGDGGQQPQTGIILAADFGDNGNPEPTVLFGVDGGFRRDINTAWDNHHPIKLPWHGIGKPPKDGHIGGNDGVPEGVKPAAVVMIEAFIFMEDTDGDDGSG